MRWVAYAGALALLAVFGPASEATAQVAGGVLRLSEGATLSTEVDGAFHELGEQGLTIEGWFYLDRLPDVGQIQTFFMNPGKYAVGVGIARDGAGDDWYDPAEARFFGSMWAQEDWGMSFWGFIRQGDDRNPPVRTWMHVAMQFNADPPFPATTYIDEAVLAHDFEEELAFTPAAGDRALYIGTSKDHPGPMESFPADPGTDIAGFRGLVDEVRVSSIVRYEGRDAVRPRHFRPDRHTLALWTFDGRRPFADKSPNGHDLVTGGKATVEPLGVEARGKLSTTCAALRRGAR
ncbi:MAG: hypothetical protein ABGY41_19645 [Candidatus Poribacteria bacterium]